MIRYKHSPIWHHLFDIFIFLCIISFFSFPFFSSLSYFPLLFSNYLNIFSFFFILLHFSFYILFVYFLLTFYEKFILNSTKITFHLEYSRKLSIIFKGDHSLPYFFFFSTQDKFTTRNF